MDNLKNPVAEAALLGAMLLDNSNLLPALDRVKAEDFSDSLHGRIFTAAVRFNAVGKPFSAALLRPIFAADSDAEYGAYLDRLVEEKSVTGMVDGLAEQVADLAARRTVYAAMQEAMTALHEDLEIPIVEITGRVEAKGHAVATGSNVDEDGDTLADIFGAVEEREEARHREGSPVIENRLISEYQEGLGGIEAGYHIIAARPGMGKTATALSLALGFALNGQAGTYFNHEMRKEQIGMRMLSDFTYFKEDAIAHKVLRDGNYDADLRIKIMRARQEAATLPLKVFSFGRCDISRIWRALEREKARLAALGRKLQFAVIDYIGLLSVKDEAGRPITKGYERVNALSATIKRMVDHFGIPIFVLSQLSRGVEQREDKRPMLSDLRESGELEQDADSVSFLYREEYYLEQSKPKSDPPPGKPGMSIMDWEAAYHASRNKLNLIIAKNRHGTVCTKTMKFLPEYSAVRSLDHDQFAHTDWQMNF